MMTFLIEAFVLCVLFHLEVLLQVRREPAKRVYGYPPAIVERYIELGKIPDKKNPSTLERVKKKWPAAIVIGIILGAIVYFVNGSRSFLNGFLISYGLWLIVDWYDAIVIDKRKIDMADEIFVINVGGYIGFSTRSEIEYATATGKTVNYLEPVS